ncbi:hypothetical protein [Micromonospora sp. NBC_01796]|uniref:hypothetical protein n=1 Tax=Micromonospora sp. NBC_01796 TaxID=2975987 RepID=UPI002DD79E80|nr:hypothetical protein [Micromonospora sp. NBC_01796]WSA84942.1 hypothetical protein OIE47_32030 [Micromonospora sp. NBC_01796]
MPPSKEQIEASIAALHEGARSWGRHADTMDAASKSASAQSLGPFELSSLASLTGLVETYGELQEKLARLLREGAANFDAIGSALRTAADGYEADERDAVHRMRGIY